MTKEQAIGTRERILAAALELFAARSYRAASMRQIAERVGITKASLYHHFRSKQELLSELLIPLLDRLDRVVTQASSQRTLAARRRALLEGTAEVMLDQRDVMSLLLRDTSVYAEEGVEPGERMVAWTQRCTELLANARGGWRERVRATQALSVVADPISLYPDVPAEQLRPVLLGTAFELLGIDQ